MIIFSATFECTPRETIVRLRYNCLRKSRRDMKLGFVNASYLQRGLALKSLIEEGGPVYGVSVQVIDVCPMFIRLKWGHNNSHIVCEREILLFRDALAARLENMQDSVYMHEDMSLRSILDQLDCTDRQRRMILVRIRPMEDN